jgi:TolA-binding protein
MAKRLSDTMKRQRAEAKRMKAEMRQREKARKQDAVKRQRAEDRLIKLQEKIRIKREKDRLRQAEREAKNRQKQIEREAKKRQKQEEEGRRKALTAFTKQQEANRKRARQEAERKKLNERHSKATSVLWGSPRSEKERRTNITKNKAVVRKVMHKLKRKLIW